MRDHDLVIHRAAAVAERHLHSAGLLARDGLARCHRRDLLNPAGDPCVIERCVGVLDVARETRGIKRAQLRELVLHLLRGDLARVQLILDLLILSSCVLRAWWIRRGTRDPVNDRA